MRLLDDALPVSQIGRAERVDGEVSGNYDYGDALTVKETDSVIPSVVSDQPRRRRPVHPLRARNWPQLKIGAEQGRNSLPQFVRCQMLVEIRSRAGGPGGELPMAGEGVHGDSELLLAAQVVTAVLSS